MKKKLLGIFGVEPWTIKVWDLGWAVAYQSKGKRLHIKPYKCEDEMKYILMNYCGVHI